MSTLQPHSTWQSYTEALDAFYAGEAGKHNLDKLFAALGGPHRACAGRGVRERPHSRSPAHPAHILFFQRVITRVRVRVQARMMLL